MTDFDPPSEMTPFDKYRTPWDMWWGTARHSRENTIAMIEDGLRLVQSGKYDAIEFNLFNKAERDFVHEYMKVRAPNVDFCCTWYEF